MDDQSYETTGVDSTPPASHVEAPRRKPRSRNTTACDACRARRTKCDGHRPACGYCRNRGIDCHYTSSQAGPTTTVEAELAAINRRLDHITRLLPLAQQPPTPTCAEEAVTDPSQRIHVLAETEESPFRLLVTESMMTALCLNPGFSRELMSLERSALVVGAGNAPRLRMIQQQKALGALDAFSAYVHIWCPVLGPGFSERYLSVISGPLTPGPESCLVMLVAAVGAVAHQDPALGASSGEDSSEFYLDAAMASLPVVLIDSSIESVQCLVLLSIYYCSLSRPCQAYDYAMIASFKVQNLLRSLDATASELYEDVKRAYWAVLLIESELCVQLDVVESGIWNYDSKIALPDSRRTWQFDIDAGSPESTTTLLRSNTSAGDTVMGDRTQSYFLAEISMRRMLHRCNTAVRKNSQGETIYAPGIALELELQLDEWYGYLPDAVRFHDLVFGLPDPSQALSSLEPQSNFLRVQYYCCKISIYWAAVWQCIQDGTAILDILKHCERFFHAYIQVMPSLLLAVRGCIVNRWTLYATIFMTSMAVMQAAQTPCLRQGCAIDWTQLLACLNSTETVDSRIVQASPSLSLLSSTLARRLIEFSCSLDETDTAEPSLLL